MRTLGLITARGGSKGVPNKHLMELGGRPLIAWTVEAGRGAAGLDRVVVSTDGEAIADVCRDLGAEVPFRRPAALAQDDSSHVDAIIHALDWLRDHERYDPEYIMLLQPTSPFRDAADIDGALEFCASSAADSVLSVSIAPVHPYFIYQLDPQGRMSPFVTERRGDLRRQELGTAWYADGGIFLQTVAGLRRRRTSFPDGSFGYRLPEGHGIQIDTLADFAVARRWLEHAGRGDRGAR
jgi:CMP-N,N'-diacetyllegionaminic acid synthase